MLFPSVFDTFGLVVQEAASCHTPAFVPENSCAAELVKDGKTGYCAPLDVSLWADRIEGIFADENFALVRENCASMVFTWREAVDMAVAEYIEILKNY